LVELWRMHREQARPAPGRSGKPWPARRLAACGHRRTHRGGRSRKFLEGLDSRSRRLTMRAAIERETTHAPKGEGKTNEPNQLRARPQSLLGSHKKVRAARRSFTTSKAEIEVPPDPVKAARERGGAHDRADRQPVCYRWGRARVHKYRDVIDVLIGVSLVRATSSTARGRFPFHPRRGDLGGLAAVNGKGLMPL